MRKQLFLPLYLRSNRAPRTSCFYDKYLNFKFELFICISRGNSLPSAIEKRFQKIEQLIIHGKFQEAEKVIEEELKKKDITKEEELGFLVQKSETEFYLGNFQKALQLAELIQKESKGLDNIFLQVDALTLIAICTHWHGRITEGLEIVEKGLKGISTATNFPAKEIAKRKAKLLIWKSFIISHLGDFEKALELGKEALSFAEECGYRNVVSHSLIVIGDAYVKLGDTRNAVEHIEKALKIATELGNKFFIGYSYAVLAINKWGNFRNQEALDLFNKCFSLSKEIGSTLLFGYMYNAGNAYRNLYQLDKTLEYYQVALKYAPFLEYLSYANMGYTYFLKYDLEQAKEYYLKSMGISEEISDSYILPLNLSNLVTISLESKELTQAKKYLKQLKELSEETGFERIDQMYRFASILVLKATGDISDLAEAAKLLKEFLAEESLPSFQRLDALYSLLEIRIKELQISANEEALKEAQKRLYHLEVEAEEQQLKWLLADVFRLQSQLALVELDAEKAIVLLEKAKVIAEEINVELLKEKIKVDLEKIEKQISMWNKLQERKAPINETVKLVSLESTVKNIKQETVLEERDEETGKVIEYRKLFALKI